MLSLFSCGSDLHNVQEEVWTVPPTDLLQLSHVLRISGVNGFELIPQHLCRVKVWTLTPKCGFSSFEVIL